MGLEDRDLFNNDVNWRTRAFEEANWDFADSKRTRELHPYPARFIPQIPGQALDLLGVEGPVLDPFCGSGTTLAEARKRNLPSLGVDLNPIACLISRVRTQRWKSADSAVGLAHSQKIYDSALISGEVDEPAHAIPRLGHWFDPWAASALAGAVDYLASVADETWRDRLSVAISSAVVRISRQESDTRYAAVSKQGSQETAAREIAQAVVRMCEWLMENTADYGDASATVQCGDATKLDLLADDTFQAAIFSPPYPNAYEYWLYHKYRMYWLGFDPIAVRSAEIGARPHYSKPNGLTELDFAKQMSDVFRHLSRALQAGSPAVVIVGDSIIAGRTIDNGALITESAESNGFSLEVADQRVIRSGRSSFNRAHSRGRRREHVLLFRSP
jgi:DNA modification methylase